ncbi:LysR substrate-binding domain-containing protein [Comamonas testosteroni]|uniref:LysR substrate-binding domain-containing protein n=1 Tax=Comamonas testosteroni TaxID=285 RepID=UPI0023AB2D7A|nr:LysR substrate-binding domain-containing protein [Comamonas testosteroni]
MISHHLRTFLTVAQLNSFSAAAKQIGVSQPYVSRQIKQLESISGGQLFERIGRSIRITDLGLDLMGVARRMMDAELEALELLNNAKHMQAGYLRIAAVGPYHLQQLLQNFKQRYPKIHVKVSFGSSSEVEKSVVEMDADIGILAASRRVPYCDQLTLERGPIVLQVHVSHRLAQRTSVSVRDLEAENFIFREASSTTRKLFDALLLEQNVQVNSTLELGSREAIRLMVANGLGIGYVSDAARDPHPNLCYVPLEESSVQTNATLIWRAGRDQSGITGAFLNTVKAHYKLPG